MPVCPDSKPCEDNREQQISQSSGYKPGRILSSVIELERAVDELEKMRCKTQGHEVNDPFSACVAHDPNNIPLVTVLDDSPQWIDGVANRINIVRKELEEILFEVDG